MEILLKENVMENLKPEAVTISRRESQKPELLKMMYSQFGEYFRCCKVPRLLSHAN